MDSKQYVLEHDFGYCREPELENLIKLKLRNFEDVKVYVEWTIREAFAATVTKNTVIKFYSDKTKAQILIEEI